MIDVRSLALKQRRNKVSQRGFSLLELMAVIFLMALGATFSWRTIASIKNTMAVSQLSGELHSAVSLAKTRALLGYRVILCPKGSGAGCGQDWSCGFQLIEGEQVLRVYAVPKALHLYWSGFPARQRIIFSDNGLMFQQNGRFIFCASTGAGGVVTLNRVFQLYGVTGTEKTRLIRKFC